MRILALVFALAACGASKPAPAPPPTGSGTEQAGACEPSGCSNTVCAPAGEGAITTCEYKAEYKCYETAKCERQPAGTCGWTPTPELTACLASPPAM